MKGIRVYPKADGFLDDASIRAPGAYGRIDPKRTLPNSPAAWWLVTAPNGDRCSLSPANHSVVEHEDGTITVNPSIDMAVIPGQTFHGWLRRGEWS